MDNVEPSQDEIKQSILDAVSEEVVLTGEEMTVTVKLMNDSVTHVRIPLTESVDPVHGGSLSYGDILEQVAECMISAPDGVLQLPGLYIGEKAGENTMFYFPLRNVSSVAVHPPKEIKYGS